MARWPARLARCSALGARLEHEPTRRAPGAPARRRTVAGGQEQRRVAAVVGFVQRRALARRGAAQVASGLRAALPSGALRAARATPRLGDVLLHPVVHAVHAVAPDVALLGHKAARLRASRGVPSAPLRLRSRARNAARHAPSGRKAWLRPRVERDGVCARAALRAGSSGGPSREPRAGAAQPPPRFQAGLQTACAALKSRALRRGPSCPPWRPTRP